MGKPTGGNAPVLAAEKIGCQRERGELKHLSTLRKRNNSLSSGERKGKSPNRRASLGGVVGRCEKRAKVEEGDWKEPPERVRVPYSKLERAGGES
jgi:hypothetical protein